MSRVALSVVSSLFVGLLATRAEAAVPNYYDDLTSFQTDVTDTVTDDYSNPGYGFNQSDAVMSGVLGETDYHSTGHMNTNIVSAAHYCAGCNGSFELSFQTTSMGEPEGVNGFGFDITSHDIMSLQYYAYITFADGTTEDIPLPPPGNFFGVWAAERIERVHVGLSGGVSTTNGYFEMDNLIIGDGFDETPCGDGMATPDEECDDMGESMLCDVNCTLAICGDGTFNPTSGELCDTGGPTAECNADCTAPTCGDGQVNMLAGEDCDDSGETATCDVDCSDVECGDDVINATAGETCDDGGQSPSCDQDCTAVACGDGVENNLAGEYCDDGNNDDGDGCSATCTVEEGPPTTDEGGSSSDDGSGSTTDGGETAGDSTGAIDDTGDDTTGGGETTAADGTESDGGSSGGASATDPDSGTPTATNGEDDDDSSSGSGANTDDGGGCGCTTADPRGSFLAFGLFGLGVLGRRRRLS
jgi:uncharacterized protein (TIGR03382 family)